MFRAVSNPTQTSHVPCGAMSSAAPAEILHKALSRATGVTHNFSADLLQTFYENIPHCQTNQKKELISELIKLIALHFKSSTSPQATSEDVHALRAIAKDLPLDDKLAILGSIREHYKVHHVEMPMKWLSALAQMADNRPIRALIALPIALPTENQLSAPEPHSLSPKLVEWQSLHVEFADAIDKGLVTRVLINKFYAVAADVAPDQEAVSGPNLDADQKTQLILELMPLYRIVQNLIRPRPGREDVIQLRTIVNSLGRVHQQLIAEEYERIFERPQYGLETWWQAAYCQIFGNFPIVAFNNSAHNYVRNIPGHALSYEHASASTWEQTPPPAGSAPSAEFAALQDDFALAAKNRLFSRDLLKTFHTTIEHVDANEKPSAILLPANLILGRRLNFDVLPTLSDAENFRSLARCLPMKEKVALLKQIEKWHHTKGVGDAQVKWISVVIQMLGAAPLQEPAAILLKTPTEEEVLAAHNAAPNSDRPSSV